MYRNWFIGCKLLGLVEPSFAPVNLVFEVNQFFLSIKERFKLVENLQSVSCSQDNLITARARKNKHSARMLKRPFDTP